MKITHTFLAIIAIFFTSCNDDKKNENNNADEEKSEWKQLDVPEYTIKVPSAWLLEQMESDFRVYSPKQSDTDPFQENVNVLVQDLTGMQIDLDSFTRLSLAQLDSMFANTDFEDVKRVNDENGDHDMLVYSGTVNEVEYKWKQNYLVANDRAFVLTYTAVKDQYDKYLKTADEIMNSFRLKK